MINTQIYNIYMYSEAGRRRPAGRTTTMGARRSTRPARPPRPRPEETSDGGARRSNSPEPILRAAIVYRSQFA